MPRRRPRIVARRRPAAQGGPSHDTTLLRVEETGYSGDPQTVIAAALDSTGGFNQVIIAAKAWLEHRTPINVVADHAGHP